MCFVRTILLFVFMVFCTHRFFVRIVSYLLRILLFLYASVCVCTHGFKHSTGKAVQVDCVMDWNNPKCYYVADEKRRKRKITIVVL